MKHPVSVLVVVCGLLSGCATGGPRTVALYAKPATPMAKSPTEVSKLTVRLSDQRSDRSIDPILNASVPNAAGAAVRKAMIDSGLVKIAGANAQEVEVTGAITKLEWFVPGYPAMIKKAFATSLLTGGLGGLAYGSTGTPVEGHATLNVQVTCGGREVLKGEYVGLHEEKLAKLKCDTFETKSRVAGMALANAVEKLIADLDGGKLQPQRN